MLIGTYADYVKDGRFVALQSLIKEEDVPVIRGKFGATQSVSVWDLVVGDVLLLAGGARVPADCVVIHAADLEVEEAQGDDSDSKRVRKSAAAEGKHSIAGASGDPFLLADSLVTRGQCKAVVCCVGSQCSRSDKAADFDTDVDTKLQKKLKNLGSYFMKYSIVASLVIFVLMVVMMIVAASNAGDTDPKKANLKPGAGGIVVSRVTSIVNFVVVLALVSIPEGLPLAVGVSLAFSVMRMYKDNLLVRKLDAPEKMGGVEEILCGKTQTITTGNMKVQQYYCESREIKNTRKNTLFHCELQHETLELIKESIMYNCEARVEMDATTYVPVGNATEVALLKFLQDAEVPVHLLIQKKLDRIRAVLPFSSEKKRSAVAMVHPDRPNEVMIYVKGAPENVLNLCGRQIDKQGQDIHLQKSQIIEQVRAMASQPLRVLAMAYTSLSLEQWNKLEQGDTTPEQQLEEYLIGGQLSLSFIGVIGLKDPLRPRVQSCVKYAREHAQMQVRLVSGDHIETAKAVAIKAGILKPEEANVPYAVMESHQFREFVGEIRQYEDEEGNIQHEVENLDNFREVSNKLRVLARATAQDKYLLTVGLKNINRNVAVTGDGINDIEALKNADIGMSMGNGVSASKEASDIILTADDFEASLRAVMWGRNIYHNITRFLQFQVTVNIACLLTVFFGIIMFNEQPMTSVQLLWINLIMDTFAALALSSEPPLKDVIKGPPFKDGVSILSPTVWRQIFGVSIWNFVVMVIIMVFGQMVANLDDYSRNTPKIYAMPDGFEARNATGATALTTDDNIYISSLAKQRHFTYIFNIFVCMQAFNMINCRKIGRRDFNVFESFFHNPLFLFFFAMIFVVQVIAIQVFPGLTQTVSLNRSEWGVCIIVGASVLAISAILKLTPEKWVAGVGKFIDEEKEAEGGLHKYIPSGGDEKKKPAAP